MTQTIITIDSFLKGLNLVQLFIILFILTLISVKFFNLFYMQLFKLVAFITIFFNSFLSGLVIIDLFQHINILSFQTHFLIYDTKYTFLFSFIISIDLLLMLLLFYGYQKQIKKSNMYLKYSNNIKITFISLTILCCMFTANFLSEFLNESGILDQGLVFVNSLIIVLILLIILYLVYFSSFRSNHNFFWGMNERLLEEGTIGYSLSVMKSKGLETIVISQKFVQLYNLGQKEIIGIALIAMTSSLVKDKKAHGNWSLIPFPGRNDLFELSFSISLESIPKTVNLENNLEKTAFLALLVPVSILNDLPNLTVLQNLLQEELDNQMINLDNIQYLETNVMRIISKMLNKINF